MNRIDAPADFAARHLGPRKADVEHMLDVLGYDSLDGLVDEVGENESHPLASLMEMLSVLIEKYEDENVPELSK